MVIACFSLAMPAHLFGSMKNSTEANQKQYAYRREMRAKAKAGDPEAIALVKYWYDATKAATQRAKEEGRGYDAAYGRRERAKHRENIKKAEAGDAEAQALVDAFRAKRRKLKENQRRNKGMLPLAAAIIYKKAAAQPAHIKREKNTAYQREWQQRMRERVLAGDPEAIAWRQKTTENNRRHYKSWKERRAREKAGVPA